MNRLLRCLVALGYATFFAVEALPAQQREAADEEALHRYEARRSAALARAFATASVGSRDYDVTYYKLDLRIDVNPTRISGSVTIRAISRSDALNTATFDLVSSMTVDSVLVDGAARPILQAPMTFDIDLGPARPAGTPFTAVVYYHGIPATSGFGSFASATTPTGAPWIWTLSEPYGARDWWPCNDHPIDKADSVDVWITVPGSLKVGSQGLLEAVLSNTDGTTTHRWRHRYPIATYLVSLAIADYDAFSFWFKRSSTDSMEVLNYVLKGTGLGSLPLTVDMLKIYSGLFGPYPFFAEKYGHAQFGWGGAMEHQTMTSTGSTGESIIAHELAHQWFGDMITLETWPHIWLNEGFATYGEILYRERRYGAAAYAVGMAGRMQQAMDATTSLYVTDTTNIGLLFSNALVYAKGATVLHMLRHVVGDSLFFAALRSYASDPQLVYRTASTEDFQRICEAVTGRNLEWFFQEWVYGERYPRYTFRWGTAPQAGGSLALLEISQSTGTMNPSFFTMPIDVKIVGLGMDTTVALFNDQARQIFSLSVPVTPTNVVLDPGNWILKTASGTQEAVKDGQFVPVRFEFDQNFPNPFNASTTLRFGLGAQSQVMLDIYDIVGRRVISLVDEVRGPGFYAEQWTADVPSGVYFARLQAAALDGAGERFTQTRAMMVVR